MSEPARRVELEIIDAAATLLPLGPRARLLFRLTYRYA